MDLCPWWPLVAAQLLQCDDMDDDIDDEDDNNGNNYSNDDGNNMENEKFYMEVRQTPKWETKQKSYEIISFLRVWLAIVCVLVTVCMYVCFIMPGL